MDTLDRKRPRPGSRRCQIEATEHVGIRVTRDRRNWLHADALRQNVLVAVQNTNTGHVLWANENDLKECKS